VAPRRHITTRWSAKQTLFKCPSSLRFSHFFIPQRRRVRCTHMRLPPSPTRMIAPPMSRIGEVVRCLTSPIANTKTLSPMKKAALVARDEECSSFLYDSCKCDGTNSTASSGSSSEEDGDDAPHMLPQVLADLDRLIIELGPSAIQVAEAWNSLGLIRCRMQKKHAAAVHCHQQALIIFQTAASAECKDPSLSSVILQIVVTLIDLGTCYELQHNHDAALKSYRKADALILKAPPGAIASHVAYSCRRALARMERT
jgi:hypothetical protein